MPFGLTEVFRQVINCSDTQTDMGVDLDDRLTILWKSQQDPKAQKAINHAIKWLKQPQHAALRKELEDERKNPDNFERLVWSVYLDEGIMRW